MKYYINERRITPKRFYEKFNKTCADRIEELEVAGEVIHYKELSNKKLIKTIFEVK